MAEVVKLPKMNLVMEEGLIGEWYKSVGDVIEIDEPLCSVENEKETGDVLALNSGILLKILASEGETRPINTPIAIIGGADEDISELSAGAEAELTGSVEKVPSVKSEPASAESSEAKKKNIKMLPKLRKIIKSKDIDLDELLAFIGKDRVTEEDILAFEKSRSAVKSEPPTAISARRERMSGMRKAIAKNMMISCENTARLTNVTEVDMTDCINRNNLFAKKGQKASITGIIIKACALALREHEILNASLDGDEIVFSGEINIGCAVDVPNGLAVPVIRQADQKDVFAITEEIMSFAKRGQNGELTNSDMSGGTFTVSSVGMLGVEIFTPIINYPQAAIMGVGAIARLPRYLDSASEIPVPRHIMKLSLTYDHRIVDGAPAARYSLKVRELLENPILLF